MFSVKFWLENLESPLICPSDCKGKGGGKKGSLWLLGSAPGMLFLSNNVALNCGLSWYDGAAWRIGIPWGSLACLNGGISGIWCGMLEPLPLWDSLKSLEPPFCTPWWKLLPLGPLVSPGWFLTAKDRNITIKIDLFTYGCYCTHCKTFDFTGKDELLPRWRRKELDNKEIAFHSQTKWSNLSANESPNQPINQQLNHQSKGCFISW